MILADDSLNGAGQRVWWAGAACGASTGAGTSNAHPNTSCRLLLREKERDKDKDRLVTDLDVMRWLCRDFWGEVFRKTGDKLQTNNSVRALAAATRRLLPPQAHPIALVARLLPRLVRLQGTYLLVDNNFRPLRYLAAEDDDTAKSLHLRFMMLPCGLVRGALAALDMDASVNVDVTGSPKVVFQVRLKGAPTS